MSSTTEAKRPCNPYSMWLNENRANIAEEHKLKGVADVAKKAGELWKAIPADKKKPYEDKYAEEKAKWDKVKEAQKAELDAKLNPEGAMKKPQTSYFLWFNENRTKIQEEHKITSIGDTGKKASELWKALTDAQKKHFEEKAAAAKKAYEDYKNSDEGKAILEKQKELKKELQDVKDAKKVKKDAKEARKEKKEGGGDGEENSEEGSPAKTKEEDKKKTCATAQEPKREAAGKRKRKDEKDEGADRKAQKKVEVVTEKPRKGVVAELSKEIRETCTAKCLTPGGIAYDILLAKLLATPDLKLEEQAGLDALLKNGGLLNRAILLI